MTVTIKQATANGNYIEISQDKYSHGYRVTACELYSDGTAGYPFTDNYYGTLKQANARFNALKRKF